MVEGCMAEVRRLHSNSGDAVSCFVRRSSPSHLGSRAVPASCNEFWQMSCTVQTRRCTRSYCSLAVKQPGGRLFSFSLSLICAILVVFPECARAQDLFESNSRPRVPVSDGDDSLLDHLWALFSKSNAEQAEAADSTPPDMDSKLRGVMHRWWSNESRADDASWPESSAPRRSLVVTDSSTTSSLITKITIFGRLGEEDSVTEEHRKKAVKWFFVVTGKSMGTGRSVSGSMMEIDIERFGEKPPEVEFSVTEPFDADPTAVGGPSKDKRSPMKRSTFTLTFKQMPTNTAALLALNFCSDYKDQSDVLLQGFLRGLENSDLFPNEGFKAAINLGTGLASLIHLQVAVVEDDEENTIIYRCDDKQAKTSNANGALFVPDCPPNSVRCSEAPDLCTEEEVRTKGWMCKSLYGYDDDLELVGKGQEATEIKERFHWNGELKQTHGYCPRESNYGDIMELEDGSDALGVIGETARPRCGAGHFNTGSAVCMGTSREHGTWKPDRWCKFEAPREPPSVDCEEPDPNDKTIVASSCKYCRARSNKKWFVNANSCDCTVHCAAGHKKVSGGAEGRKNCLDVNFMPHCPPANELEWNKTEDGGRRCHRIADGALTKDFCCNEAWGPSLPKELQPTDKCTSLAKESDCLTHHQADSGAPCCWSQRAFKEGVDEDIRCAAEGDSSLITTDKQPQACAVRLHIPDAKWEELPKCVKTCDNIFSSHNSIVTSSGCDKCVPGETAPSCDCDVNCKGGLVWVGGGPQGSRTCSDTTLKFDQSPPVCQLPEPAHMCPSISESTKHMKTGCNACVAGSSFEKCPCQMDCAAGYKRVGAVVEGQKLCHPKQRDLESAMCSGVKDRSQCLSSKSSERLPDGMTQAPCCWRQDGFTTADVQCLPMASPLMSIQKPPQGCADQQEAEWDALPECEMKCPNIFAAVPNVVETHAGACDDCVASLPDDCKCEVQCKEGSFHVGGGQLDARKCLRGAGASDPPSFGMIPVCMVPEAGSESFMHGLSEVKSRCSNKVLGADGMDITGCVDCKAGDMDCPCSVECADGFKRTGSVESGEKKCREVPKPLAKADCSSFDNSQECLGHSQNGGAQDKQPCCWRQDGLQAGGGGKQCAARGSPDIQRAPEKCANTLKGLWDAFPTCVKKCINIFKIDLFTRDSMSKLEESGCDDCVPGEECPCKVRCAIDPKGKGERLLRVAGGEEDVEDGPGRQCTAEEGFGAVDSVIPICRPQKIAGEAKPICDPPVPDEGTASRSLSLTSCDGCTADDQACECNVKCATGYMQTPDAVAKTGDQQGMKKCNPIAAALNDGQACTKHTEKTDCLGSKDKATGKQCCWLSSGFVRDGEIDNNLKCAALGDSQHIGFTHDFDMVAPEKCAAIHSYEWEPMPKCKALCINSFKGLEFVVDTNCDECFADHPENEQCKCEANCAPKVSTFFPGAGTQGRQSCGWNPEQPLKYRPAPQCLPAKETKAPVPVCAAPQDSLLDLNGCDKCRATKDDKKCDSCDMNCRKGYKQVGGSEEGAQVCKQGIFRCPRLVNYNDKDRTCTNKETGDATSAWCCGEYLFSPATYDKKVCSTIKSEEECMHRMDEATSKQCCWRELTYDDKEQRCAADESGDIDDGHIPDACANRPLVPSAEWAELPQCEELCPKPFSSHWRDLLLIVTGCGDCVASKPDECDCTVNCDGSKGYVWIGGGSEGARQCHAEIGFGKTPICDTPDPDPVCDEPVVERAKTSSCEGCVAGDDSCQCQVECSSSSKDVKGYTTLKKKCVKKDKSLTLRKCTYIPDRASCLASKDQGSKQVCCWREDGFSLTEADGGAKCVPKSSEILEQYPDACAATHYGEWDELPVCKPKCENVFRAVEDLSTSPECDDCVAGQPCPDCKVLCRPPLVLGGGGTSWQCTEDSLQFSDPPICWEPEKAPLCPPPTSPNPDGALAVQNCRWCFAGQELCPCSVVCASRYVQPTSPPSPPVGKKQCHWLDRDDIQEATCTELGEDEGACLNAKERDVPCCYRKEGLGKPGGPKCARRGDPAIKVDKAQCTLMKVSKWDEMPVCKRTCDHMFASTPNLAWDPAKCSNVCWQGGECTCEVHCQSGAFDNIGGGAPGPRSCGEGSMSLAHWMEDPPVCWERPEPPICHASDIPAWLKATDCENCVAGQPCPSCKVDCQANFQHVDGNLGGKKCLLSLDDSLSEVANCEEIRNQERCLTSYQPPEQSSDPRPCCWRGRGFFTDSVLCTATRSANLEASFRPDQCTVLHKGSWEEMPSCTQECPNIFRGWENIDQTSISDCDHCVPGGSCKCSVQCDGTTKPVPGSGLPGPRACQSSGLEPSFDAPPQCKPVCEVPDDRQGRLNLAGCKSPCFPGYTCDCKISCAAGNEWSGGGAEGQNIQCKKLTNSEASFLHDALPVCNPVCEAPDSQSRTMDTSRCQTRCEAGDAKCECEVKCFGKAAQDDRAGQPGKKICMLVPGDQNTPARAVWADAAKANGGTPSYDEMPNCMQAIVVTILDARNQVGQADALVQVFDFHNRQLDPIQRKTNAEGNVIFFTKVEDMYFVVTKDGFSKKEQLANRLKRCADPAKCRLHFTISRKLESHEIHPAGCYFTAKPGQEHLEMRAILMWNARPLDLDIWVRNTDCAEDARQRYKCFDKSDDGYQGGMMDQCERHQFVHAETKALESQACRQKKCEPNKETRSTDFVVGPNGKQVPVCEGESENQFPKWVFWGSQYVDKMSYRIEGKTSKKIPTTAGWTEDDYMVLNTDQRRGFGPETVTFHNPPPGTYQIVVDLFDDAGMGDSPDIKEGMPHIDLFIGGNDVVVKCEIPDSCDFRARVWYALNIKIEKMDGVDPRTGEDKYSIRIIDKPEKMAKLHPYNLPTNDDQTMVTRLSYDKTTNFLWPITEEYFEASIKDYTIEELQNVCHGTCHMSEDSKLFEDCLDKS